MRKAMQDKNDPYRRQLLKEVEDEHEVNKKEEDEAIDEEKGSAGQRWDRLSRTVAKAEQEIFKKIPRKWTHNENHEYLYRELVDIRLVGRCRLEGLEWFLKNGASIICIVKFLLDIIKSKR